MPPLKNLEIRPLSAPSARENKAELFGLFQLIPGVNYRPQDVTATKKDDGRVLHAKWKHSHAAFVDELPVGVLMAYEREAEGSEIYPENTLYLSELAVTKNYRGQGIAKLLLAQVIGQAVERGNFHKLRGPLNFSLQTAAVLANERAQRLYRSFGFKDVGYKDYDNRSDVVMRATPEEIIAANASRS